MLKIIFTDDINPISDNKVVEFCGRVLKEYRMAICKEHSEVLKEIIISNEIVLNYFRLMVKENLLISDEVVVIFNNKEIKINQNGKLSEYPNNFCCVYENIIRKLW